jgi:hypothetical protein
MVPGGGLPSPESPWALGRVQRAMDIGKINPIHMGSPLIRPGDVKAPQRRKA